MSKSFIIDTGVKAVLNLKKVSPENKKIFTDDKKSKETNVNFSEHELSILKKLDQHNIENSEAKQNDSTKIKTIKSTIELGRLKYAYDLINKSSKETKNQIYLNDILIDIVLPINEIRERNPILEKRCEQLRIDQEQREYKSMTKNVDTSRKFMPEDTIAFQMKQINKQLIAVAQFVFSVLSGFLFGFLGIELIIGNLDFGFRLLLGIIVALIIALAEIYFLAKKLSEEYDVPETGDKKNLKLN
ncbi:unnamed protein product [Diamesa hyperborea]